MKLYYNTQLRAFEKHYCKSSANPNMVVPITERALRSHIVGTWGGDTLNGLYISLIGNREITWIDLQELINNEPRKKIKVLSPDNTRIAAYL